MRDIRDYESEQWVMVVVIVVVNATTLSRKIRDKKGRAEQ